MELARRLHYIAQTYENLSSGIGAIVENSKALMTSIGGKSANPASAESARQGIKKSLHLFLDATRQNIENFDNSPRYSNNEVNRIDFYAKLKAFDNHADRLSESNWKLDGVLDSFSKNYSNEKFYKSLEAFTLYETLVVGFCEKCDEFLKQEKSIGQNAKADLEKSQKSRSKALTVVNHAIAQFRKVQDCSTSKILQYGEIIKQTAKYNEGQILLATKDRASLLKALAAFNTTFAKLNPIAAKLAAAQ